MVTDPNAFPDPNDPTASVRQFPSRRPRPPRRTTTQVILGMLWQGGQPLLILAAIVCVLLGLLWLGHIGWMTLWTKVDDVRYGTPRTTHHFAHVGHKDDLAPSKFTFQNIDGQVLVTQVSGNNPSDARTFEGPFIWDRNAVVTGYTMRVNADEHPDLVVEANGQTVVFFNEAGTWRLMTRAERMLVQRKLQEKKQ